MSWRAFAWIVFSLSLLAGVSAVPAQEGGDDCSPESFARFSDILGSLGQAFRESAGQDVPGGQSGLVQDSILLNDAFRLKLGVRADHFAAFYIGTESAAAADSPLRLTIELPQDSVTATAGGRANLRTGPATSYELVGTTQAGQTLDVIAAVNTGGFDWLNVQLPDGAAWLRSDLVRVSDRSALAAHRPRLMFDFDGLLPYTDSQRTTRCPLPSVLLVQTPPNTAVAYDVNGLTLLQSGTAVITLENFAPSAGYTGLERRRAYFTNVLGSLETISPLIPFRVSDPDRTFAVEFDETGTAQSYVGSFTQAEQELATSTWRFACETANLYNLALSSEDGAGFLYADAPCTGTFASLHPGWNAALEGASSALRLQ